MNCPNCNEELQLEGEHFHSEVDLDGIAGVEGYVAITFACAECSDSFGEYDFELELDITNFSSDHDDEEHHELSVSVSDESYDEYVDPTTKAVHPGASAAIQVSCVCGKSVEYQWSSYETLEEVARGLGI